MIPVGPFQLRIVCDSNASHPLSLLTRQALQKLGWLRTADMRENQAPTLLAFKVKQRHGNVPSGSQGGTEAARCCLQLLMGAGTGTALQLHQLCGFWRLGREAQVRAVS